MSRSAFVGLAVLAAACGGKAVVDGPPGSGGAGGVAGTGGSGTSSVSIATSVSSGAPTCADLEAAYATELENAKACNPDAGPDAQECTFTYPADMRACCTARVAVNQPWEPLDALSQAYEALGCLKPCELDCPPQLPVSGVCNGMTRLCDTVQGLPD
jgi:hypothetical protein